MPTNGEPIAIAIAPIPNATGMATSGFLVEVERVDLNELMKKYSEAFQRPYLPDAGLRLERVLEKSE